MEKFTVAWINRPVCCKKPQAVPLHRPAEEGWDVFAIGKIPHRGPCRGMPYAMYGRIA